MNGKNSTDVITKQVRGTYDHDVYVHWQHSKNIIIHDQSYRSAFNRIMLKNACPFIVNAEKKPARFQRCEKIMDKAITHGMTVAFTRHFENMK